MGYTRMAARLFGSAVLWGGATLAVAQQQQTPTVEQLLSPVLNPKHANVAISTPTPAEYANCKVELVRGQGNGNGWLLKDAAGRPLRRFFDSKGTGRIDVWSYYLDGQEVYRMIDTNNNGKADQFRWLGASGSRWAATDASEQRIATWMQISAEEASQEALVAVATNDFVRLQALFITDSELRTLGLPEAEAARIRQSIAQASTKFQALTAKLKLTDKAQWVHLETAAPQCTPADALGSAQDLIRYKNGTILYGQGDKHDFLQTGEMILVGKAWRLIGSPSEGADTVAGGPSDANGLKIPDDAKPLLTQLKALDDKAPAANATPTEIVTYNLSRADLLTQIVGKLPAGDREIWVRQVADCLAAASQSSPATDRKAYQQLVALRDQVMQQFPASPLAAYVTYRELSADYFAQLAAPGSNAQKVQEAWVGRLKKFVEDYPAADDTPDALLQLGMASEFAGKETEAKNYYGMLVKQFAKHPLAAKAQGAIHRLELDGKPLALAGQPIGGGQPFDIASLRGKAVVVYYWSSNTRSATDDFTKLKGLLTKYGSKGLELVTVDLDQGPAEGVAFLQKEQAPGTHLASQPGGLDSPLAVQYGVIVLPQLILVGKDGNVVSRSVQINSLEDEVKKLLP